jgi:hypothetical protein
MPISVNLNGPDGNTYALLGIASSVLKQCNRRDEIKPLQNAVMAAQSYEEAVNLIDKGTYGLIEFHKDGEENEDDEDEDDEDDSGCSTCGSEVGGDEVANGEGCWDCGASWTDN